MIRPLLQNDLKFIASVKDIDFSDGWDFEMLNSSFKNGNLLGFIAIEEKPIAFITYFVSFDSADIFDVYVLEGKRRKGYADKLISLVESSVKEKGVNKILLEVKEDNDSAINLYEKKGYKKISERQKYYADGKTAFIMLKEI